MHIKSRNVLAALLASATADSFVHAAATPTPLIPRDTTALNGVGGTVQLPGLTLPAGADQDRQTIVDMFTSAYDVYRCVLSFYFLVHRKLIPSSRSSSQEGCLWT